jgi:archaellum component FlaD/FlaE
MELISKERYEVDVVCPNILERKCLLTSLGDDIKTTAILTKWIEYLVSHMGKSKTEELFIYYNEIMDIRRCFNKTFENFGKHKL